MKIEILDEARQDLVDGFKFYESCEQGVGQYFFDSIFADIDSLRFFGGIHQTVHGHHRLIARRFPFAIYYRVENDVIKVCAVLDCRRNPAWLRGRLGA